MAVPWGWQLGLHAKSFCLDYRLQSPVRIPGGSVGGLVPGLPALPTSTKLTTLHGLFLKFTPLPLLLSVNHPPGDHAQRSAWHS